MASCPGHMLGDSLLLLQSPPLTHFCFRRNSNFTYMDVHDSHTKPNDYIIVNNDKNSREMAQSVGGLLLCGVPSSSCDCHTAWMASPPPRPHFLSAAVRVFWRSRERSWHICRPPAWVQLQGSRCTDGEGRSRPAALPCACSRRIWGNCCVKHLLR